MLKNVWEYISMAWTLLFGPPRRRRRFSSAAQSLHQTAPAASAQSNAASNNTPTPSTSKFSMRSIITLLLVILAAVIVAVRIFHYTRSGTDVSAEKIVTETNEGTGFANAAYNSFAHNRMSWFLTILVLIALVVLIRKFWNWPGGASTRLWLRTFLTGETAKNLLVTIFIIIVVNLAAYAAATQWPPADVYWNFFNNRHLFWLTNGTIFIFVLLWRTQTKPGKYAERGLLILLALAWIGYLKGDRVICWDCGANNVAYGRGMQTEGSIELAKARFFQKYGDLTPDLKVCRDQLSMDDPTLWAIGMAENRGRQWDDAGKPATNLEGKSTSLGMFQIVNGTSYEVGKRVNPGMSMEEWLATGEVNSKYDRRTVEGSCATAMYLKNLNGYNDWLASESRWSDIAAIQYGELWSTAKAEGKVIGAPVTIAPGNIRVAEITAQATDDWNKVPWHPADLYPNTGGTCSLLTPVEPDAAEIVFHYRSGRVSEPALLGVTPEEDVKAFKLRSVADHPVKVMFRYKPYTGNPTPDIVSTCNNSWPK